MDLAKTLPSWTVPSAKDILAKSRKNLKPWVSFFGPSSFKLPINVPQVSSRLAVNIEHFQSNYFCVFLALVIYCIVTSPLLLFAIAACLGGCYMMSKRNAENPLKIGNHTISLAQQYALVGMFSFPLFFLAGAGTAVFWVLGASVFLIICHAALFDSDMLKNPDETFTTPLQTV